MPKKIVKILLVILLILVSLVVIFIGGTEILYRVNDVETNNIEGAKKYTDKMFGYSLVYPNTWEKETPVPFLDRGFILIYPRENRSSVVSAWYKDSEKISNIDELLLFVEDDAKYIEEAGGEILEIKEEKLNDQNAIYILAKDESEEDTLYSKQYYISDFGRYPDQVIFVWTFTVQSSDREFLDSDEVNAIRDSFVLEDVTVGLL